MLELENAVFTKKNSFSTRFGSDQLSKSILASSNTIADAKKIMSFQDELLLVTGEKIYSYIPSSDSWADRGFIPAAAITSKTIVRNTKSQSIPDGNTLKGVSVYAWEEGSSVKASVIDESSGLPILSEVVISAAATKPKVFANNTYLFVYYIEGNDWKVRKISPTNLTSFDAANILASDINNNFDLHPHGNNLVYIYNSTGGTCNIGYIQQDGTIGGPINGFPTDVSTVNSGSFAVAIVSRFEGDFDDAIYALYANNTDGLLCSVYDLGLGLIGTRTIDSSATLCRNITAVMTESYMLRIYYELFAATTYNSAIKMNTITNGLMVGTIVTSILSLGLSGKAFKGSDGGYYVIGTYESPLQSTYFLLKETFTDERLQVASVIAKYEGGGLTAKSSSLANVANFKFPNLIKTELQSADGNVFSLLGIQETTISFDSRELFNSKELGKNLHIAGGVLYDYDGVSAFEHNYYFFPETPTNSISPGGGAIEAGTRQYVFVYEWTDNQGQLHRSAPSIPISVTNALNDSNTLTVPTLRVTRKCSKSFRTDIRIVGYRTTASGTIFYRFTTLNASNFNNTQVNTVAISDPAADTFIRANDVLYTTGDVLENYGPDSVKYVEEYRNRLIAAGLEDVNLVRYSQERVVNDSIDFAEELSFRADTGKGPITGIARLDEKLIIFKPDDIYYQIGQGPTATGAQDDYQQPIFITTDVGTEDSASIVSMPLGLMFKSKKGYYLLSRALEPIYIGQEVESYNHLTCTGATLVDDFNEVRFTHSEGVTLTYNYNQGQWSVFTNKEAISSTLWKNQWVILNADNQVFVENKNTFFDGQIPVTKKITTSWIQSANFQGAQRIYRVLFLGKLKSKHRMKIEICYDFDPSIRETFLYDTEEILGSSYYGEGYYGEESYYGGADPVYQIEIRPSIQKCQSIRFTLQDLNDDGVNGAGFELTGMTVQIGVKQGLFRPNINKRVGPS